MEKIKVSVALTTYNGSQLIIPLLDSLRKQTYPIDEVIICDDHSQDQTVDKILEFIHRYQLHHWKVFINKENLGHKRNLKEVLKKVNGEYIFFCEQDNFWDSHKVENIMNLFMKIPNVKCINTSYQWIDNNGKRVDINSQWNQDLKENELINIPFEDILISNVSQGCTMALKKEIKNLYLCYSKGIAAYDWEINCIASLNQGLYYYHCPLTHCRIHQDQTMKMNYQLKKNMRLKKCLEVDCLLNSILAYAEYLSVDHLTYLNECIAFSKSRVLLLSDHQTKKWLELMKSVPLYKKFTSVKGILFDLVSGI